MNPLSAILLSASSIIISSCTFAGKKIDDDQQHARVTALYYDKAHSKKCLAVFDKLRKNLKKGMTSDKAFQSLGVSNWLEEIHEHEYSLLAGWIPVDFVPERAFVIHLYPNADNWSNYTVYFSLSHPHRDYTTFTIKDFLTGKVKNNDIKMHQFALCHARKTANDDGRIEIFPRPK